MASSVAHEPHISANCPVCGVRLESWIVPYRGDTLVTLSPTAGRHIEAHYE